jgi:hypothetical protein
MLDKAFENTQRGKVLGVLFDSTDMTWRLPDKKIAKSKWSIKAALESETSTLKEWQCLVGRLNDISQLCQFMKCFKHSINQCLHGYREDAPANTVIHISQQARRDLLVWAGFLAGDTLWLPISSGYSEPPRCTLEFVSDAAGLADQADWSTKPGCGHVGFSKEGTVIFANQMIWPQKFIQTSVDEKGVRYGDKTTTLEVIGMIMPLLLVPETLANNHVKLMVDCFGTVYGMQNKMAKGDNSASVFIRAAFVIAAYLNCTLHVQHLPRVSDWGAQVTDRLSRAATTNRQDLMLIRSFSNRKVPSCLVEWFDDPKPDFSLVLKLLDHVKSIM